MSETLCPTCGDWYERIASHWSRSCGYPEIDAEQRAILNGLVLAGATVAGNGTNRHLTIGTTTEKLAEWTAAQLNWLCHSVRVDDQGGDRDEVYRVRTTAHPACNRYERWEMLADSSGRAPTKRFDLSALTGRVWWAFAGGLAWSGPYDSQRRGIFSAAANAKQDWITRVLANAGFEPTAVDRRVVLPPTQLDRWLDWIGDPVCGVKHKWAESLIDYRVYRAGAETEIDARSERYRVALEVARERTDGELTPERFDDRVDAAKADDVADWLGGGSWAAACRTAGVSTQAADPDERHATSTSGQGFPESVYEEQRISETERDKALRAAAEDCGEPLTRDEYQDWQAGRPNVPSGHTIRNRWGWADALLDAGVEPGGQPGNTTEGLLTAVARIDRIVDEDVTTVNYREHAKKHEPSIAWFYDHKTDELQSWKDVQEAARKKD